MEERSESWYAILRIPTSVQDKFDEVIRNRESIKFKFSESARRGIIKFRDRELKFTIKDMPCVIELSRLLSKTDVCKIDDVSQILLCSEIYENPSMKSEIVRIEDDVDTFMEKEIRNSTYLHGLTPPMKNVVKHRFRKTKKSRYIDAPQIDLELKKIFRLVFTTIAT